MLWPLHSLAEGSKGCIQGDGVSNGHAVGLCDWKVLLLTESTGRDVKQKI